jgi:hypothetical protein
MVPWGRIFDCGDGLGMDEVGLAWARIIFSLANNIKVLYVRMILQK